jgi:hypothetical protein
MAELLFIFLLYQHEEIAISPALLGGENLVHPFFYDLNLIIHGNLKKN